jgi:excisionase family DNA binding protein
MSRDLQALEDRYYRSGELARLLHVDESTVKRWADRGLIRCYRTPGGHRKFTVRQIRDFIREYRYEAIGEGAAFSETRS